MDKDLDKGQGEFGDANAFGLNEFGQAGDLNPMWGAVAGTGLGTLGAIGVRQFTKWGRWSEWIGFGLGAVASGALMLTGSREAGWTGLASSFLNNGVRALEYEFFMPRAAANGQMAGHFGDVVIEPTQALQGGLGIATVEPSQALLGAAQYNPDPSQPELVGATLQQASDHVQLVGGPALAAHAGHWGATHFNH